MANMDPQKGDRVRITFVHGESVTVTIVSAKVAGWDAWDGRGPFWIDRAELHQGAFDMEEVV